MTNTRAVDVFDAAFDEAFRRGHKADTDTIVKILREHGYKIMAREPTEEMMDALHAHYAWPRSAVYAYWDAAP